MPLVPEPRRIPRNAEAHDGDFDPSTLTRREQYAEQTRQAILAAARGLFSQRGYFSTTVDDIAKLANVASVTVYVAAGGKSGLLRTLTDQWSTAPIMEATHRLILESTDPAEILRLVANTARKIREEFGDIVVLMLATAPHDNDVSESLALATSRYRASIRNVVQRLLELHALREGMTEDHAVDVLWFFFGYWGLYTLHVENGWSFDQAESWLGDAAIATLLRVDCPPQAPGLKAPA